jgi:DNA mismatch endonuclease (patch repair protein)
MRANRRRDTGPELLIRSLLHRAGLRFRVDRRLTVDGVACRPDIVFSRARVAVFVDGCFWHGCPEHGELPRANRAFWEEKLGRNAERDRRQDAALSAAGWRVVRIWEHEDPAASARLIEELVRERSPG